MTEDRCSFLDTDIILKIGGFQKERLLSKILMSFNYKLYIHEYIVNEELILKGSAFEQFEEMVAKKEISIIGSSNLENDQLLEYTSALSLLAKEMDVDLNKRRDKNAGEVNSMAIAYALGFKIFISDDRNARVAANKHLQYMDGSVLSTIRMNDIIIHLRENENCLNINRKTAKQLYIYGTNPKLGHNVTEIEQLKKINYFLKKEFDEKLWMV